MRSRLLTPAQLEDLLATPSLEGFIQALGVTPYGPSLQEALTRYSGVRAVDEAVARDLQRATRRILEFADGPPRRLIGVLLLRWDLENLRALVRGRHAGRSPEQLLEAVIPAGTLGEVALRELAGHETLTALAGTLEALGHPFAPALAQGVAEYARTQDLIALELWLDRAYAEYVLREARGGGDGAALREILTAEIDAANVKTALRLASAGAPLSGDRRLRFYIPGGRLVTEKLFLALSSEDRQAWAWGHLRAQGFPVKAAPTDLVAFERELDLGMMKAMADRYVRGDPLGLDIVIGYLAMKAAEAANLRLIARGKLLGLPREAVRREMVVV